MTRKNNNSIDPLRVPQTAAPTQEILISQRYLPLLRLNHPRIHTLKLINLIRGPLTPDEAAELADLLVGEAGGQDGLVRVFVFEVGLAVEVLRFDVAYAFGC